ncbi:PREDICTED: CD82 antigen-like [Poecilia mexicana]|uniref:Tetraspanin n=1 Tax=Poecilia mexicana TaxID=48701 RepID=A0A3B3WCI1_9TELE|nr:PREDICTED: CD82 antigen-like [Poecilia mexicana]
MGKKCLNVSKYFLFLFNLIFFLLGVAVLGFGLWLLLDNESFTVVINNVTSVKVACYILVAVGAFSMLMGFVGCVGAIYEIRCVLGLYFTCLVLILIAQIVAGSLIYFQKEGLHNQMSQVISKVLAGFSNNNTSTERAWNFVQKNMECCGWTNHEDWKVHQVIKNSSELLFPCSCQNVSMTDPNLAETDPENSWLCKSQTADWPVYSTGCSKSVESWLLTNIGVVLGICVAVAFIELLGMVLSVCMCRNFQEDYSKVPKY